MNADCVNRYASILFRYKVLVSLMLILDITYKRENSTDAGGTEGAAPIGTVVFPLFGVQNQPWAH